MSKNKVCAVLGPGYSMATVSSSSSQRRESPSAHYYKVFSLRPNTIILFTCIPTSTSHISFTVGSTCWSTVRIVAHISLVSLLACDQACRPADRTDSCAGS